MKVLSSDYPCVFRDVISMTDNLIAYKLLLSVKQGILPKEIIKYRQHHIEVFDSDWF